MNWNRQLNESNKYKEVVEALVLERMHAWISMDNQQAPEVLAISLEEFQTILPTE